jgi:serine/threonine protein kinase
MFGKLLRRQKAGKLNENTIDRQINSFSADCESLIRKMLVLQPSKRVTIEQIKRHRWMMVEVMDIPVINTFSNNVGGTAAYEPNDQILRIMQNLGIDAQRTRESLKVSLATEFPRGALTNFSTSPRRQTATIITLPFTFCSWSVLRTRTTQVHSKSSHPNTLR